MANDAESVLSAPSDESGGLDHDWTRLPAEDAASRETRDPAAILAVLAATPAEFGRLLDAAPNDALTQPSQDGGAAVVEIVAHLRDWEAVVGDWIDRILTADAPPLLPVPDDSLWAIEHDYAAEDPRQALAGFRDRRAALLDRLGDPEAEAWARTGIFGNDGEHTVQQILDLLGDRDAAHLQRAREALS
ncbi:MAG: DinB family protein [Thermomicrobiales bacterium]